MTQSSENRPVLAQKKSFIKTTIPNQRWKLFNINFWCKSNIWKIVYTKLLNFSATQLLFIVFKISEWLFNGFQIVKYIKTLKFKGNWIRGNLIWDRSVFWGWNIWNKAKKFNQKHFCVIFDQNCQSFTHGRETLH